MRDEIALLADMVVLNEEAAASWGELARLAAEDRWGDAVRAGIDAWDADHPCVAIREREAELGRLCPDRVLRSLGAAALPGMGAVAP